MTPPNIAAAISRVTGHLITYEQVSIDIVRQQNEILARMYTWLNEDGYQVDIPALRGLRPGLMNLIHS